MRRTAWSATLGLTLAAGMMASFDARAEGQLVAVGWGGVWQDAYRKAVFEPFMKETGIKVVEEEFGGEYAKLTSQIEAGKVTWDVAAFESPQVIQGCDEGSFVKLDWESMGALAPEPWGPHQAARGAQRVKKLQMLPALLPAEMAKQP